MAPRSLVSLALSLFVAAACACAESVTVKQTVGSCRGFLSVRSESGKMLAHGELTQSAHGARITSRMVFHFLDGSLDDETVVFSQDRVLKLISDRHIQKGPFFPKDTDWLVEESGQVTGRTREKGGTEKVETDHLDLPPDVSNGIVGTLLLNVPRDIPDLKVAYVAPTGKGRLIHLDIAPISNGKFRDVGLTHTATIFRVKIELGGAVGVIAPVIGKQPKDMQVWVLEGEVPALVRQVGQLYEGGPLVSIEVSGATFPTVAQTAK